MNVFTSISSKQIAARIGRARHRVLLAAPGIRGPVADALIAFNLRPGAATPAVILDCNEEVCRVGFGEVAAVKALVRADIPVRQCAGLRIGVLVCDEEAWSFAPAPLSVEEEPQTDETPNAVRLTPEQASELIRAAAPELLVPASLREAMADDGETQPEIGTASVSAADVKSVEQSLEIAPPLRFDLQRQVQVFLPYIQYVELNLTGCSINRHTVRIPKEMVSLATDRTLQERLRTTFSLISADSKLSDKPLQDELEQIRKTYTRTLGKPWGRMMLKSSRTELDRRIGELRDKVEEFGERVKALLAEEIDRSVEQLVEVFHPVVVRNPPESLRAGILDLKPTSEQATRWLTRVLRKAFPSPDQITREMRLECIYKDVTYESLNHEGLQEALETVYPDVEWNKPFREFNAAREQESR